MKMWKGRFKEELSRLGNDFNSSMSIDYVMYKSDIKGSLAHSQMLYDCKIISEEDYLKIQKGLKDILADLETGNLEFNFEAEDIHMFIEEELTERIGDAGKRLHTARSRNDQVALDVRLYLKEKSEEIKAELLNLIKVIISSANENLETVMPGYTHLQIAQPVTFAHHIMAYAQMFYRDLTRLEDAVMRMDEMPLGSCALATTTYPINRDKVREILGFSRLTENSMDSVSDRDFIMELNAVLSIIMVHLSRFSEEIIIYSSNEFSFIELSDAYSTGSSIMPQKKNPDMAELIRGKSGRIFGNLMGSLVMMKGLPLAYNKDMQEDKENIFDSFSNTLNCLRIFSEMIKTMKVNGENMKSRAGKGFINATDCADYLVGKKLPFRDAYKITGELVAFCIDNKKTFEDLTVDEFKRFSSLFDEDIYKYLDIDYCVSQRNVYGGPSKSAVEVQIKELQKKISSY